MAAVMQQAVKTKQHHLVFVVTKSNFGNYEKLDPFLINSMAILKKNCAWLGVYFKEKYTINMPAKLLGNKLSILAGQSYLPFLHDTDIKVISVI